MNNAFTKSKKTFNKTFKVLSMANLPFLIEEFKTLEKLAEVTHEIPDQGKLLELIPEYDAYFCSLEVKVTKEIIDAGYKLKAIVTPSTGTDHIDVEYAKQKGIEILSLKNDYELLKQITATAEIAFGLMLAAVRKIPWGFDAAKAGYWARDRFRGMQISGKTLGILGYGRLGEIVADYAKAFRMKVIACDVRKFKSEGVNQVDFDTLVREADIISIHIHLTPDNKGIIGKEAFAKMKNGVVIINTSRGAIIDEKAFLNALESGKIGAAGVDVIDGEWREDIGNHMLIEYARKHENLLITPHLGGVTFESQKMAYGYSIKKLYTFLKKLGENNNTFTNNSYSVPSGIC